MSISTRLLSLAGIVACAAAAPAQIPQLIPFPRTMDLMVVDSTFDGVWRKIDRNQDGDFNDAGEITVFYDDLSGVITLTNPNCIAIDPSGACYIGDSTADVIVKLLDQNGDGDALSPGEATIFFDASNAGGIVMASIQGLTVDALGTVFAAVSNVSSGGDDMILRLSDTNQDGDANDAGEASQYCVIPNSSGAIGDSIPTEVVVAPDGNLYYADVGATGVVTKGVWQLHDANGDGDCNDPGEVNLFWAPQAAGNPFYWGLAVDRAGVFYMTDHGTETVWRAQDVNLDNVITPNEESIYYQTGGSTWWDVVIRPDGVIYVCEDTTPDRITALQDQNNDRDALDPGESWDVYDDTISPTDTRPRGAALTRAPILSIQPGTVRLGQATGLFTTTPKPFDTVGLLLSDQTAAPVSIPPFGYLELNQAILIAVATGTSDARAWFTLNLTVPNDPSLVGSLAFQAVAGDVFRLFLSNADTLTITP